MENMIWTRDEAGSIVEMFEDILDQYYISVPSPEDEDRDPENNCARLFGSVYFGLLDAIEERLVDILERKRDDTRIVKGVFPNP